MSTKEVVREIATEVIDPMFRLLPEKMNSKEALVLLLAIGLQESRLIHRKQINGPAKGLWQFERNGGVRGVLNHARTSKLAVKFCDACALPSTVEEVYQTLQYDDLLAAGFARLLLWTIPGKLPELGDSEAAWDYYIEGWRPGKPHRHTWDALYALALDYVKGL